MDWKETDELERFKVEIDLRLVARWFGYGVDRDASGRHCTVMRNQAGDKVVIRVNPQDGHYEYFSVRDDRDHGSVIDFVQRRVHPRPNLGEVRKRLRDFMGWVRDHQRNVAFFPKLDPVVVDLAAIELSYNKMGLAEHHLYLQHDRSIPVAVLQSKRFRGRVRVDARGNAVFPHFGKDGVLCGYEIRNWNFKAFSAGGRKGLWLSHQWPDQYRAGLDPEDSCLSDNGDFDIVFCESAIDALSHAVLFPVFHRRYASIGGRPSEAQVELLKDAIRAMQPLGFGMPHGRVIAAMDSDASGSELCEVIASALRDSGRTDLVFVEHVPENMKDWNDVLRGQPRATESYSDIDLRDPEYVSRTVANAYHAVQKDRKA